jgi:tetratricopeptide (TPR) repeat protein
MLPEILGCYQSRKQEKMGGGGTGRGFVQRIEWLALRQDEATILLFPLSDNQLPLPLPKSVSHEDFLEHFLPEPLLFNQRLAPAALVLSRLLADVGERLDQSALPEAERALHTVVLAALTAAGHKNPPAAVRAVIEAANVTPTGGDVQKQAINAFGIHLRKRKDFDTAIAYYRKALELAPGDERLLFNLARALFEKGDDRGCQAVLEEALARDPEFTEARKFLRFLERRRKAGRQEDFPDITP